MSKIFKFSNLDEANYLRKSEVILLLTKIENTIPRSRRTNL